ncbi:uncharacterized protein LOC115338397 [Aquila chrysaetos chrysaetos]|uniref:uncharacterized protein LOC115338397 n=1 Tax=Aquila chrysaetos chrysaetos TaxID=223781 RepID=UPI001B7D356E|nr:uncharacterized protein LOC115338397 [Aquila chrysaetos chrysaetos]
MFGRDWLGSGRALGRSCPSLARAYRAPPSCEAAGSERRRRRRRREETGGDETRRDKASARPEGPGPGPGMPPGAGAAACRSRRWCSAPLCCLPRTISERYWTPTPPWSLPTSRLFSGPPLPLQGLLGAAGDGATAQWLPGPSATLWREQLPNVPYRKGTFCPTAQPCRSHTGQSAPRPPRCPPTCPTGHGRPTATP